MEIKKVGIKALSRKYTMAVLTERCEFSVPLSVPLTDFYKHLQVTYLY